MSPTVSIVIPTLDEAAYIGSLLQSLAQCPNLEVIVVDGGSTDGTVGIVGRFPKCKCIHSATGRGLQLNCGARAATGEQFIFLHADSQLPDGWLEAIDTTLKQPGVVAGSFPLKFDENHWLLRLFGLISRCNNPLVTYGDQGFFMSRKVFESIGGFRDYPILEDVEIQCRLRRLGRWKKTNSCLTTSARRFAARGILRQQLTNIAIVGLYLAGASPWWLSRFYLPQSAIQPKPFSQSASRKPTALKESDKTKGLFTRLPF